MNLVNAANEVTMTSREIAEVTGKQHTNVIRDIREMIEAVKDDSDLSHQLNQGLTEFKDVREYTSHFELNRFAAEILVTGYDVKRRARVIGKLLELESTLKVEVQTKIDRQYARLESPELTYALKSQREAKGKKVATHTFINDYNMMNKIVLGLTSAKFRKEHEIGKAEGIRDYLSPVQTEAMLKIQRINTSLIEIGMEYQDRKEKLQQYFDDNFKDKMIEEVLRLES